MLPTHGPRLEFGVTPHRPHVKIALESTCKPRVWCIQTSISPDVPLINTQHIPDGHIVHHPAEGDVDGETAAGGDR